MNPFKICDRVRFSKDNIHNVCEEKDTEKVYDVLDIGSQTIEIKTKRGIKHYHHSRFELAEPKFANVKVGDWVELDNGKCSIVINTDEKYFTIKDYDCAFINYDGYSCNVSGIKHENKPFKAVIRIVPPSEVEVDFGAFRARVIKNHSLTSGSDFFIHLPSGLVQCMNYSDLVSSDKRSEVRALLKTQEEQ